MKSFEPGVLQRQAIPAALVRTVRLLGEFKARQVLLERRSPAVLDRLRQAALFDSARAFCRLEGLAVSPARFEGILAGCAEPSNRAEEELAGHLDALTRINSESAASLTSEDVLRLHADLYRHVPEGGGRWKDSDNLVVETREDGATAVIFTPVPAYAAEDAMERLHDAFAQHVASGDVDPLLLVPAYLLDFLAIHPFSEGTWRVARLLAGLLLARAGYRVAPFVSLDALFEETRATCLRALQASWHGWHQAAHTLVPWWEYFLGTVLTACERLERATRTNSLPRGAKRDMVMEAVRGLPREFRHADVERALPAVSRPTINRALKRLRDAREIACVKPGRNARWVRT